MVVLVCLGSAVNQLSRACYLMLVMRSVLLVMSSVCVVCVFLVGLSSIPRVLVG